MTHQNSSSTWRRLARIVPSSFIPALLVRRPLKVPGQLAKLGAYLLSFSCASQSNVSCRRIDALYLDNFKSDQPYRLETYRSQGSISATASQQLRCYFINKCSFPNPPPASTRTDGLVTPLSLLFAFLIATNASQKDRHQDRFRSRLPREGV